MNIHKSTRWLGIIFFVFVVMIVGLAITGRIPFSGYSDIILGFGVALVSWLFTYGFSDWIDRDEKEEITRSIGGIRELIESHVNKEFPPHKKDTTTILDVLNGRELILVNKKRKELDNSYYEEYFKNAKKVKISGYANKKLLTAISENKEHPLVKALKEGNEVVIEILMLHPISEYVKIRDNKESIITDRTKPCSEDILTAISLIKDKIIEKYSDVKLPHNNRLILRLTRHPLNTTLTYVCDMEDDEEKMLLGFLFHHKLGYELPMYQVPRQRSGNENGNNHGLFNNCIGNFDELFMDARDNTLLRWDKDGCKLISKVYSELE